MACRRHFMSPTTPALDLAAAFLEENWRDGPLDLRHTLVIVPTRHAGRRLRERLALDAARRGTAVLSGPVFTPARLFQPSLKDPRPLAAGFVARALWIETLSAAAPALRSSLKLDASTSNRAALKTAAQHLVLLRETLGEEGCSVAAFAQRLLAAHLDFEPERWTALAELEAAYLRVLDRHGYRDDVSEKLRAAENPTLPEGVNRVAVLFVPDPAPLSITALDRIAQTTPVHVCVHAEESDNAAFDAWGRPLLDSWLTRQLPALRTQIEVCDDPMAVAERVREHVSSLLPLPRTAATIGAADALHAEVIETTLARDGVATFNPAGVSALRRPLCSFLSRLFNFRRRRSFNALVELARHPCSRHRLEAAARSPHFLAHLDEFQNEHVPWSCDNAREIAERCTRPQPTADRPTNPAALTTLAVLNEVAAWLAPFDRPTSSSRKLSAVLPQTLQIVFQGQTANDVLVHSADVVREAMDELQAVEALCPDLDEQCDWLMDILAAKVYRQERSPDAIEILGWLELAWEDAPILLLTDMNDGLVPETASPHPFLPDHLRRASGLRTNDHRFARDAHVLECLLRSRPPENVRFFVTRRSADGNPLKPSRLLLQCAPHEIAQRALHLFYDHAPEPVLIQRSPGLLIRPPPPQQGPLPEISITALRDYLADPFAFYLRHILKVDEPFAEAFEMDALAFGSVCHRILQAFGTSEVRDSQNADEIRDFLKTQTHRIFDEQFGRSPSPAIALQCNLVLRRMDAFAQRQAEIRKAGWEIVACEHPIALEVAGVKLRGRIDRVDRHSSDGRYRIMDYKTAKEPEAPEKTHRAKLTKSGNAHWFAYDQGDALYWKDLQLPLYGAAWRQAHKDGAPLCLAYFALPDDTRKTDVLEWADGIEELVVPSAWRCAERILKRAQAGIFWPPANKYPAETALSRLFFDDTLNHLDPNFVEEMQRRTAQYDGQKRPGGGGS
jgi:ATP-dependent helicase/nuclease subunit B